MIKRSELTELANLCGLEIDTYSPGDGITRYKVFRSNDPSTKGGYFAGDGIFRSIKRKEVLAFLNGFAKAKQYGDAALLAEDLSHKLS